MGDERAPKPLNKRRGVVVKHTCIFQQPYFQKIIKVLKSSYMAVPEPLGSYYTLVPLVTVATVDFVYNYKQATPLTWAVIIIEGVLVVSVHT